MFSTLILSTSRTGNAGYFLHKTFWQNTMWKIKCFRKETTRNCILFSMQFLDKTKAGRHKTQTASQNWTNSTQSATPQGSCRSVSNSLYTLTFDQKVEQTLISCYGNSMKCTTHVTPSASTYPANSTALTSSSISCFKKKNSMNKTMASSSVKHKIRSLQINAMFWSAGSETAAVQDQLMQFRTSWCSCSGPAQKLPSNQTKVSLAVHGWL